MKALDKQITKYFKNHVTLSNQALNVINEGADKKIENKKYFFQNHVTLSNQALNVIYEGADKQV